METKDLQIVIDLKDVYVNYSDYDYYEPSESEDVNSALKRAIQDEVTDRLIKGFSPEIIKLLKEKMVERFEDRFSEKVSARITRAIEQGVFSDEKNTFNINQYVKQKFEIFINNSTFIQEIDKLIKRRTDEMQDALQERYDMSFATGIIKNIRDAGLLKDGASEMLLKEKD